MTTTTSSSCAAAAAAAAATTGTAAIAKTAAGTAKVCGTLPLRSLSQYGYGLKPMAMPDRCGAPQRIALEPLRE
jgi:hypothetical protein